MFFGGMRGFVIWLVLFGWVRGFLEGAGGCVMNYFLYGYFLLGGWMSPEKVFRIERFKYRFNY